MAIPLNAFIKRRPPGAQHEKIKALIRPTAESPSVHHAFLKSFDGTRIFYSTEGQGKPLIFVYGLVCSSLHWTYQIEYFRHTHQAVWFDYRGHQNSETPADMSSLNIESLGKDLGRVLDELKIDKAVIIGHSMGVNAVLEFYRQQPNRFEAMVLANGTSKRPLENIFHINFSQKGFELIRKAHEISPEWVNKLWRLNEKNPFTEWLIRLGGFNPLLSAREDVALYVKQVSEMDPAVFIKFIESYEHYDATAWLHEIKVPTLILAGEHDHITPLPQQQLLHQLIPGSELEIVKHGSHCSQMDLPELVNLKIERFLRKLGYL